MAKIDEKSRSPLLKVWLFATHCMGSCFGRLRIYKDTPCEKYPDMKPEGKFYWWFFKNTIVRMVGFLWMGKVRGLENIPSEGPFLVVPNHASFIDFMIVMDALSKSKHLTFFIKEKYFEVDIWNQFLREMLQIKADRRSIILAKKVLQQGRPLVLFAEGTRTRTGEIGSAYPGLGIISSLVDVPVIPMGIKGAYELWPWNRKFPDFSRKRCVDVSFGAPLRAKNFPKEGEFSDKVMREIKQLTS